MSLSILATPEERKQLERIERIANSRSLPRGLVQRADILARSLNGMGVPEIARAMRLNEATVRKWLHRFQREGFSGLEERSRRGRPRRITPEQRPSSEGNGPDEMPHRATVDVPVARCGCAGRWHHSRSEPTPAHSPGGLATTTKGGRNMSAPSRCASCHHRIAARRLGKGEPSGRHNRTNSKPGCECCHGAHNHRTRKAYGLPQPNAKR